MFAVARPSRPTCRTVFTLVPLLCLSLLLFTSSAAAATVNLGNASSFSVLGGSAVTNTGPTVLNGDLGVTPGTAISGFPPGTVNGTVHATDGVALSAQADLTTAYNDAAGRSSDQTISADLAGLTLGPGTYTASTTMGLSGDLTLDGHGDPNAVFVFQVGSALDTASGSHVLLVGQAQPCNVFWQVGSSATIGSSTQFVGNILALTSISLTTGATVEGRALARNGAVTLDTNVITASTCATGGGASGGGGTTGDTGRTSGGESGPTGGTTGGTPVSTETRDTVPTPKATAAKAVTVAATKVGTGSATLGGKITPGSGGSTYRFQYGPTRSYGSRTPVRKTGSGTSTKTVTALIKRLRAGRTYHFRIVVTTSGGRVTYGRDRTLRTRGGSTTSQVRQPHFAG